MRYLDQVICETLRFHNLVGTLQRVANEDYKIPGHDLVIKKGTKVWINIIGIHMDPKNYNNPEVFDPENSTWTWFQIKMLISCNMIL